MNQQPPLHSGKFRAGRVASWALVALALVLAVITLGFLRSHLNRTPVSASPTARPAVVTVSARPPAYRSVSGSLAVTGTISAWDELNVGSEANGLRIEAVHVDEGDHVRRGQVLAELNSSILSAQLQALRARHAQASAAVSKALQPNRPQDILALESAHRQAEAMVDQERANLLQAQANLGNARTNAARYSASLNEGFVTAQETENRQTELERAQALVEAAKERVQAARFATEQAHQRLDMARAGGRSEDVSMAQASLAEISAQIQQVEAQLAQTRILAPDDGLIVRRQAHLGDIASPGKTLFTMVRQNRLELRAQVPEVDLERIQVGQKVTLEAEGRKVSGRVWQISPTVDPATRLGVARVDVPASSGLRPGQFVRGNIALGARQVLTVPPSAVQGDAGRYFVYVLDGDVAHKKQVEAGTRTTELVEITRGLQPGQHVIVEGAGFVNDGDTVTVKP